MTAFQMYLFTRMQPLLDVMEVCSTLFSIPTVFMIAYHIAGKLSSFKDAEQEKFSKNCCITFTVLLVFLIIGRVIVPTQKEMAAIIIVPKILTNENIDNFQRIGADGVDIVKLATEYTKEVLSDTLKQKVGDKVVE